MSKQMTPWFPASVKPVRRGVYQIVDAFGGQWYSKWTGTYWTGGASTVVTAATYHRKSIFHRVKWRGLTAPAYAVRAAKEGGR